MILQEKKIQEFSSILSNDKARLILVSGPPGCGKNSLIDLYCKSNNIQVVRYKDEQDSRYIYDTLDIVRDYNASSYPGDLENLNHFLRINARAQGSTSNGLGLKTSSFAAGPKSSGFA